MWASPDNCSHDSRRVNGYRAPRASVFTSPQCRKRRHDESPLYRRKTTGEVIRPRFAMTHYPYFWQYNFSHGLKAMVECGLIRDPRCSSALDLLVSKRTPDGGFPAERKYYSVVAAGEKRCRSGQTLVGWGPTSQKRHHSNEFVTAEALSVLKAAGRL